MSDVTDAVDEAKLRNRQLAARHLVHVQDLEAEIAKLAPDDPRLETMTTELAAAKYDYQQALTELKELDRLAAQAQTLEARSIMSSIDGDPVLRSAEQVALDNVRDHVANLDAQVKLSEELGERAPAAAPAAKPTREEADDAARKEFEALRTKPKKTL
jgi:hypothetical protein